MAISLKDLLAQREALEARITELQAAEHSEAIAKVRTLINEYGLTQEDVFPRTSRKNPKTSSPKVAAKFRDPVTGKEWSGRGLAPKWLKDKNRKDFLIS